MSCINNFAKRKSNNHNTIVLSRHCVNKSSLTGDTIAHGYLRIDELIIL